MAFTVVTESLSIFVACHDLQPFAACHDLQPFAVSTRTLRLKLDQKQRVYCQTCELATILVLDLYSMYSVLTHSPAGIKLSN